jgi:hypothetical protein
MPRRDEDDEDFEGDDDVDVKKKKKKGSSAALQRLQAPAICLMVVAGLHILVGCVGIPLNIYQMTQPPPPIVAGPGGDFAAQMAANRGINLATGVIVWLVQGVILFGAIQMRQAKMYGLSMATSILSCVPCVCTSCLCFGIPFGIWSLIVLMDQEVKSAFTS